MILSDISIKNSVFAWMIMVALIVFGAICFRSMGVSQMPDVDYPMVSVNATLEGAAPEVMETQVAEVLESAVMTIEGIKEVSSTSRRGSCRLSIEFELGKDIDSAMQEVESKISAEQRSLPKDMDPPVVRKSNPEDQPIVMVTLTGERSRRELMQYVNDHLKDRFTTISGVGDVDANGFTEPNLRIWVDKKKLKEAYLTVKDIINTVGNQHTEMPAGYITAGEKEINVRVMGEAATPEEFGNLVITGRGGSRIWKNYRIKDVAKVEDALADIRRVGHFNGKESIGLGIMKQRGSNAVAVAKAVRKRVEEIQKTLPEDLHLQIGNDSTRFIEESTAELNFTIVLSALLTGFVCWAFLGSFSSTVNVLLAIPTSIVGAFIILKAFGFTLNTFTLLGLSLAIGIVVDDAIMMLENIVRHNENGEGRVKSAFIGAREMAFPAMAASVAILAIFVPVVFMKGIIGKYFFQFGITMSAAVLLSLLEALTLSPMRCAQFVDAGKGGKFGQFVDGIFKWLAESYRKILNVILHWRWTTILLAIIIFAASMTIGLKIPREFTPSQDQSMFSVRMQTPIDSSFEHTAKVVAEAEKWAMEQPNIEKYFGAVGGGSVNSGMMFITMKHKEDRVPLVPGGKPPTQQEFMQHTRQALRKIKGLSRVSLMDPSQAGFTARRGYPIELSLRGPDWAKLAELSAEMRQKMTDSGLMTDVDTDYLEGMPEFQITPDRDKAAVYGVSISDIADTINSMIGGVRAGKFTKDGKRYDVRVKVEDKDRAALSDIESLYVRNNTGELIPLGKLIKTEKHNSLQAISRRDRERAISIYGNPAMGASQAEALDYVQKIAKEILPDGYRIVLSGSSQAFGESFQSLIMALIFGIFVAYMVLASQFNSYIHPITVLLALPFSVTGAFIALKLGGQTLNIYSMIGMILLMGIVKKNSILLVEFTNNMRREKGRNVRNALLEACPIRLRPILMTSFATIAAAVPPALGIGPGAETRIPMSLVIIGGVFFSTFLTLFVVPCAYSLFSPLEDRKYDRQVRKALEEMGEKY